MVVILGTVGSLLFLARSHQKIKCYRASCRKAAGQTTVTAKVQGLSTTLVDRYGEVQGYNTIYTFTYKNITWTGGKTTGAPMLAGDSLVLVVNAANGKPESRFATLGRGALWFMTSVGTVLFGALFIFVGSFLLLGVDTLLMGRVLDAWKVLNKGWEPTSVRTRSFAHQ